MRKAVPFVIAGVFGLVLLAAGVLMCLQHPRGTLRLTFRAPERVWFQVTVNPSAKQPEQCYPACGASGYTQVLDLEVDAPKIQALAIKITGGNAEMERVQVLDGYGEERWSAPDRSGAWTFSPALPLKDPALLPKSRKWGTALGVLGLALLLVALAALARFLGRVELKTPAFAMTMAAACAAGLSLYYGAFRAQMGARMPSESWIHDTALEKARIAAEAPGPRTFVLAGSSALYGVSAEMLARASGTPVVNLGLHAGVPVGVLLEFVDRLSRPGDTVVLHLEYHYFQRTDITAWEIDQASTWGAQGWAAKPLDYGAWTFLTHVPPERVLAGLLVRTSPRLLTTYTPTRVVTPGGESEFRYGEQEIPLNAWGDRVITEVPSLPQPPHQYIDSSVRGPCKDEVCRWLDAARAKGLHVFYAFPASIRSPLQDFTSPEQRAYTDELISAFTEHGAIVLNRPEEMHLPAERFSDTPYHLDEEGRRIHTGQLYEQLKQHGWPSGSAGPEAGTSTK